MQKTLIIGDIHGCHAELLDLLDRAAIGVHWGLYPGVPLDQVPEDVRAGTTSGEAKLRERYGERPWYDFYEDDKPVVFGHAVVGAEPLVLRDRIFGLDTGACHGMRLTGLLLPTMQLVSVPARANHWVRVRSEWQAPVLRSLAWSTMTFEQIDKKVRSLRDPELGAEVLDGIIRWVAQLREAIPQIRERLDAEVARITGESGEEFGRVAAAHPAGSWLIRRQRGRLSAEHLGCPTPRELVTLAAGVGVQLPAEPL